MLSLRASVTQICFITICPLGGRYVSRRMTKILLLLLSFISFGSFSHIVNDVDPYKRYTKECIAEIKEHEEKVLEQSKVLTNRTTLLALMHQIAVREALFIEGSRNTLEVLDKQIEYNLGVVLSAEPAPTWETGYSHFLEHFQKYPLTIDEVTRVKVMIRLKEYVASIDT